jgi:hypothetical protein
MNNSQYNCIDDISSHPKITNNISSNDNNFTFDDLSVHAYLNYKKLI